MVGEGRDSEGLSLPLFFFSRGGVVRHHFRSPLQDIFLPFTHPAAEAAPFKVSPALKSGIRMAPRSPSSSSLLPSPAALQPFTRKGEGAPPKMGVSGRGRRRGCFGFLCARVAPERGGGGKWKRGGGPPPSPPSHTLLSSISIKV